MPDTLEENIEVKYLMTRFLLMIAISGYILLGEGRYALAKDTTKIPDTATAITLDGETVSLADHRGKLVLLIAWRTDCVACLYELPILNRLQKKYSDENFTIIGLSMDRGKNNYVAKFVKKKKMAYPVWLGYGQPIMKYTLTEVLPTMFAIGPNGELLGYHMGAFRSYEEAVAIMKQARVLSEKDRPAE